MIKFLDLAGQYEEIKKEVDSAVSEVLSGGEFILGRYVESFERNVSRFLGLDEGLSVSCASGSDALLLALMALGVGPGDEVITVPFTFFATAGCIERLGAKIVFVDVDEQFNMDASLLEGLVTSRTKAVISVDLYGKPCDQVGIMRMCRRLGLAYISDSSQSMGATIGGRKVGTLADFTTFSFFPSKNLGGCGDGGMVVCGSMRRAEKIRRLRAHGSSKKSKYHYDVVGMNSRLDALQASILDVKLRHLEGWVERRRAIAMFYDKNLVSVRNPQDRHGHAYHQYTVLAQQRNRLKKHLADGGVPSMVYYPLPLHLQKCFKHLAYEKGSFPNAERYSKQVLSIPVHEGLQDEDIKHIANLTNDFGR